MASNRAKEKQEQTRCERGRKRREQQERERNTYKRVYLHATTRTPRKPNDTQTKNKTSKPKEKNVFTWTDSGLELGAKRAASEGTEDRGRGKKTQKVERKEVTQAVLSRRINFTPSSDKEGVDDKR